MKKLVTIAGAVLLAGFANAAAVSWNSGTYSNGFVGPDGNSLASSTAYTMLVTFYSDAAGTTKVTESTVTSAKPNGAYTAKTGDVFDSDKTYYVTAILKANDNSASLELPMASFTTPGTGDGSVNFTTGAGFDSASYKWTPSSGWATSGGVPEPTSGLLLLVGAGMLALRRKQK